MKRFCCGLAVVAALALPATAETKVKFHKEFGKLLRAANEEGRCALVVFTTGSKNSSAERARNVVKSEPVKQVLKRYLVVGRIPVNKGGPLWERYGEKFDPEKPPFWLVVTPQQEVLAGGDREAILDPDGDFLDRLESIGKSHPPVDKKDREKAEQMLQEAWQALQEGNCYEAAVTAAKLREVVWFPPSVGLGAERLLNHIELRGRQGLRQARALRERNPVQAAKAYQQIVEQFTTNLVPGREADKELRLLLAQNSEAAQALEQYRREGRARELLARAKAEEKKKNLGAAKRFYRIIVRSYEDTDSFPAASKALARLDPDYTPTTQPSTQPSTRPTQPTTAATTRAATQPAEGEPAGGEDEAAARSLLQVARNLHAAGLDEKAGDKLMQCMREHPGTEAARTAASLYVEWGLHE
jgi:hypothetical protein